MTYQIETTDPISGTALSQLVDKPFVVESDNDDDLVIYFETKDHRDEYLMHPEQHPLEHYRSHPGYPHL